jgi:hypothetical protein
MKDPIMRNKQNIKVDLLGFLLLPTSLFELRGASGRGFFVPPRRELRMTTKVKSH